MSLHFPPLQFETLLLRSPLSAHYSRGRKNSHSKHQVQFHLRQAFSLQLQSLRFRSEEAGNDFIQAAFNLCHQSDTFSLLSYDFAPGFFLPGASEYFRLV